MPSPEKHYRLSPSQSHRWLACPHSLTAPDIPPGKAAQEGTHAHNWAAKVLTGECMLTDVPDKWHAGIELYAQSIWENGVKDMFVERRWASLTIPNFGGTIDCAIVQPPVAAVYDFKTGKWPVAAKDNSQLLCYAAILSEHFHLTDVHGVIIQPRAFKGDKYKPALFSKKQIAEHRNRVISAMGRADKQVGDHCRFCSLRMLKKCDEGVAHGKQKGWK